MANFVRNPTETVTTTDQPTRSSTLARTVKEDTLVANPNAVAISIPVYLIEESI